MTIPINERLFFICPLPWRRRFGYAGLPWTNFVSVDDPRTYSPPNAAITNSPFAQMGCEPFRWPSPASVIWHPVMSTPDPESHALACKPGWQCAHSSQGLASALLCRVAYGRGLNLRSFYLQPYCRNYLKVTMYGYYRVSLGITPVASHLQLTPSHPQQFTAGLCSAPCSDIQACTRFSCAERQMFSS